MTRQPLLALCAALVLSSPAFALTSSPQAPLGSQNKSVRAGPGHPGELQDMSLPGDAAMLPIEPTGAGPDRPEPHGKMMRDSREQLARDRRECRETQTTNQGFRNCLKAARDERNTRIRDNALPTTAP